MWWKGWTWWCGRCGEIPRWSELTDAAERRKRSRGVGFPTLILSFSLFLYQSGRRLNMPRELFTGRATSTGSDLRRKPNEFVDRPEKHGSGPFALSPFQLRPTLDSSHVHTAHGPSTRSCPGRFISAQKPDPGPTYQRYRSSTRQIPRTTQRAQLRAATSFRGLVLFPAAPLRKSSSRRRLTARGAKLLP
jgi:hypothetical protein